MVFVGLNIRLIVLVVGVYINVDLEEEEGICCFVWLLWIDMSLSIHV